MRALACALLAACGSFPEPSQELACQAPSDCAPGRVCDRGYCVAGEVDAGTPDEPDAMAPFDCAIWSATRAFSPCALPPPSPALALATGAYRYDTTTGTLTAPDGATTMPASIALPVGRVLSVEGLSLGTGASLLVLGDRPLVIASWSTIDVRGAIDAGSTVLAGPGANPAACVSHASTAGGDGTSGASGGGGGGFQGLGGRGGQGDQGTPGTGGAAVARPLLQGGCPGAAGGTGDEPGGGGGHGGGAVQLTARISIELAGRVTAGGAGGGGAGPNGGGGGGGSGGMVALEAPTVTIVAGAIVAANGGGGGQGSEVLTGGRGQDGIASDARSAGGTGGDSGTGGLGSGGAILGGNQGQSDADHGAGGGGGAAGFVVIASAQPQLAGTCSPPASLAP